MQIDIRPGGWMTQLKLKRVSEHIDRWVRFHFCCETHDGFLTE
jgi:hypothetical protein